MAIWRCNGKKFVSFIDVGSLDSDSDTAATELESSSAADTLSMLTQSMLGTMPSAVATAAAAGLFMRVSSGNTGGQDNGGSGKSKSNNIKISLSFSHF